MQTLLLRDILLIAFLATGMLILLMLLNRPVSACRTEGEAILVNNAISHPPFSAAALGELPQVLDPRSWRIPAEEVPERRDLRSGDYLICSVDPPGGYHKRPQAMLYDIPF